MKKFKFPLQQVFEYKKHLEKKKQQEVAYVLNRLEAAKKFLSDLVTQRTECQQERMDLEKKGCKQVELLMVEQHNQHLKKKIKKQQRVINDIQIEYQQKQNELLQIVTEKKSLEIYRDKKYELYKKELLNLEQHFLDEVAMRQFHITQRAGLI